MEKFGQKCFLLFLRGDFFFFIESPHTDISIPSQINQQPNIVWSLSSGKAHFEPTAQDMYIVYESAIQPEHTKCASRQSGETLSPQMTQKNICFFNRSNCCQESKKLVEECEEERKSGCKEIFDGNKPLQALSSISGLSTLFPRRCPGCPFSCPPTTPCRVPQKDQHGVRYCKLIGLGRANRVLACPFRCF